MELVSPKKCDHTSVGMLVYKENKLLLIERKKFPFGFAPPAGHVDSDSSYEKAAIRELGEEVGLDTEEITLVWEGRKENPCRRLDGTWHYWKIFKVDVSGAISRSLEETKQANFYSDSQINDLSTRTLRYLNKEVSEEEWQESPGLEPIWYEVFKDLNIIRI